MNTPEEIHVSCNLQSSVQLCHDILTGSCQSIALRVRGIMIPFHGRAGSQIPQEHCHEKYPEIQGRHFPVKEQLSRHNCNFNIAKHKNITLMSTKYKISSLQINPLINAIALPPSDNQYVISRTKANSARYRKPDSTRSTRQTFLLPPRSGKSSTST